MEGSLRIIRFEGRPFWQARVYDKRKRGFVTRSLKTTDVGEAQAKAIQFWSEVNPRIQADLPVAAGTVEETIENYIAAQTKRVEAKLILPGALRDMRAQLKPVLIYCNLKGLKQITDVKAYSFNDFIEWRRHDSMLITTGKAGVMKPLSLNKAVRELRAFWKWVQQQRLASFDIAVMEQRLRHEQVKGVNLVIPDKHWTLIERELVRVAFKAVPTKKTQPIHMYYRRLFYYLVMVLAVTGMRPQEATHLIKWKDFSLKKKDPKKQDQFVSACVIDLINPDGKGSRKIVSHAGQMIQQFRKYANNWRQENGFHSIKPTDLIFAYPRTNDAYPYSQLGLTFRQTLSHIGLAGKGYTLRSLRATYITEQLSKGVSPYLLSKNTGHSIEVMKKHYEDLGIEDIADALL